MQINGLELVDSFIRQQPGSATALRRWIIIASHTRWTNVSQVKEFFGSADYVAPYTVFNIGGNKWRLISLIEYDLELVVIKDVLTHKKYNAGKWRR